MSKPHFSANRGSHSHPPLWTHDDSESGISKALIRSARHGELDNVILLLNEGADIDERNVDGWTALFAAASNGHVEIVRLLLDRGSKITRSNDGEVSVIDSHNDVTNPLFSDASDCVDIHGYSVLMKAVYNNHFEIVQLLLERGASPNSGYDPSNREEHNISMALIIGASFGNTEIVRLLLDKGAAIEQCSDTGMTALMFAAGRDIEIVKLLLERGAKVDSRDIEGKTAFMFASESRRTDTMKLLLDNGAEIYNEFC